MYKRQGVLSKHTLGNGHAADVVYAAAGDAVQIREGGHEMEPVASIRCQRGGKLCPCLLYTSPVSTRRTQAISGGAPKANLSDMIMTIMPITIANVMII